MYGGRGEAIRNWQWEGEADACPIIAHRFPLQANKGAIATVYPSRNGTIARRAGVADPGCAAAMTPQCLQDLYQIPADPATQTSNKMFVSSFVQSFASRTDLSSFLSDFRPDMASDTTFQLAVLNGGENDESRPSIEGVSSISIGLRIWGAQTYNPCGDRAWTSSTRSVLRLMCLQRSSA